MKNALLCHKKNDPCEKERFVFFSKMRKTFNIDIQKSEYKTNFKYYSNQIIKDELSLLTENEISNILYSLVFNQLYASVVFHI